MEYTDDLCTGGTVHSDGDFQPYTDYEAFDDNESQGYLSDSGFPHWIGYAFTEAHAICQVRVKQWGSYYADSYIIQGSNDPEAHWGYKTWTTLYSATGASANAWDTWQFENTTPYQYVRLRAFSGTGNSNYWGIYEIEMMAEYGTLGGTSDGASLGDSIDAVNLTGRFSEGATLGDTVEASLPKGETSDGAFLGDTVEASLPKGETSDGAFLGDSVIASVECAVSITDGAFLGDTVEASLPKVETSDGAFLGDSVIASVEYAVSITDGASLGDTPTRTYETSVTITDGGSLGDASVGFNWTDWIEQNAGRAVRRYYFTLTGDNDGTTDVEIPCSSWQARHRSGDPSYLSVSIPYTAARAAQINARPNGEMIVELAYLLDGEESVREEIIRADLEDVYIYEGARSKSIVLVGHKTITFSSKHVTPQGVSYKRTKDGAFFLRADPDLYLKPGDIVNYDGDSFTAGLVTYYVGPEIASMEVKELT